MGSCRRQNQRCTSPAWGCQQWLQSLRVRQWILQLQVLLLLPWLWLMLRVWLQHLLGTLWLRLWLRHLLRLLHLLGLLGRLICAHDIEKVKKPHWTLAARKECIKSRSSFTNHTFINQYVCKLQDKPTATCPCWQQPLLLALLVGRDEDVARHLHMASCNGRYRVCACCASTCSHPVDSLPGRGTWSHLAVMP